MTTTQAHDHAKQKMGKKRVDLGNGKKKTLKPFEDDCKLASFLEVRIDGSDVGAYILRKGEASYKFVFGFECRGIHTTLRQELIDPVFDAIEAGLKDFPEQETLTIHLKSFTDDTDRQNTLNQLIKGTDSNELKYLIMGEKKRIQDLTKGGIRKPKTLYLFVTYTVESGREGASDKIEEFLMTATKWWNGFIGKLDEYEKQQIERVIEIAFNNGYQFWERLLSNQMGLSIRPLSAQECWNYVWQRFNNTPPRSVPQLLSLTEAGVTEEVYSEIHPVSLLMEDYNAIPFADRRWINLKDQYTAVMLFLDKPEGWRNKESQMRYLWQVMAKDEVYDTDCFCEISKANIKTVTSKMHSLTKQANVSSKYAEEKNTINVKAQLNIQKNVEAQAAIYEGAVPFNVSVVFLVHRDSPQDLDQACYTLKSYFPPPAWMVRETEYPWKIWLETLPISWNRLLMRPFKRSHTYLSHIAPGLMPVVKTRTVDRTGFELISAEGGTPVFIDLFKQHKNLGIFGTTRSGKSVLASGIITQALAHGIPISAMDYPKPDGSSTFSDYTAFLGDKGAYFDIGREAVNLFELPNLKGLDAKLQQERLTEYKEFLVEALMLMVLGSTTFHDRTYTDNIRAMLSLAIKAFFDDDQIHDRYVAANINGLDSQEWQLMPTLADFIDFCSLERLRVTSVSGDILQALDQVKLRLRYWINSRVGQAISRPSTFRSDAQLLVFALRNISSDEDAALLSLGIYSAALRRSLASPVSIFFIDESPILFQYNSIAELIGRLCANGAKAGIRVILSAQDPDTISKSPSAAKIFQNITTRLVGRIQPTAVDSFVDILKYPSEIINKNATEGFFPKQEGMYSQWLLDDNGIYTYCRFYPGSALLTAVANNPEESAIRQTAMRLHPQDKIMAMHYASKKMAEMRNSEVQVVNSNLPDTRAEVGIQN
ncbi:MAG: hypothetical protein F6K65_04815 [Moorea sp. SIO3C2]|nr:hypothetical protein [Moorena sp. SIO3C2]